MTKFNVSLDDLLAADKRGYSVYGNVLAPGKVILKRESFPEGEVPAHLKTYVGQTGKVAHACKGRKGQAYVECLRTKAKEMGITKK